MYLIINNEKRILFISTTIEYNVFGGYILDSNLQVDKSIGTVVFVEKIPDGVKPKYYYYKDNQFIFDENYYEEERVYTTVPEKDVDKIMAYNILMGEEE